MRLAYLSASSGLGGAERCLVDLLAVVRQFEPSWRLHLIVPSEGPLPVAAGEFCAGLISTLPAGAFSGEKVRPGATHVPH